MHAPPGGWLREVAAMLKTPYGVAVVLCILMTSFTLYSGEQEKHRSHEERMSRAKWMESAFTGIVTKDIETRVALQSDIKRFIDVNGELVAKATQAFEEAHNGRVASLAVRDMVQEMEEWKRKQAEKTPTQ